MQSNGTINGAGADTPAPAAATAFTTAATHHGNGNRTVVGATHPADSFVFKKAVKHEAKGRIALVGPAGAGKSYTMLKLARALAGPNGKIAAIDTEHGSLSKYADLVEFDVLELDSFTPQNFLNSLHAAENAGYAVFCADSLSHFWVGKDGALEFVDMAAKRNNDNFGGWKAFRPYEREMVDAILASPCHVICTMRTKTEYQDGVNAKGKKIRVKVGLAPVQRDGMEYEFDLVGYMDEENTLIVDKTRCSYYAQKALSRPGEKEFAPFVEWLAGAPVEAKPRPRTQQPIDTGGHPVGTQAAADYVARQKIAAGRVAAAARVVPVPAAQPRPWSNRGEMRRAFLEVRELLGES